MTVLEPGDSCWRTERARRVSFLVDNEPYYAALGSALRSAKRSIHILGWAFDPRTRLAPDGREGPDDPDEIGRILVELCRANPKLDVRVLVWRSPFGLMDRQDLRGHRAKQRFANTSVVFREARDTPIGACHHQKIVVIDDQLAFCGGGDITTNRWDSKAHRDDEPRRTLPDHARHPPRHEVTLLVEGPAAGALGDLFRQRWTGATGEVLPHGRCDGAGAWPAGAPAHLTNVTVGIARTGPAWRGRPPVEEVRRLTLACIENARETIYLENQYFSCAPVAVALARRLREPSGPEVVLVVSGRAPSWFDHMTMDHARNPLIRRLRAADRFGRFRALSPSTAAGVGIIVHSKVGVFDDRVMRVGSANLNNRSEGFDTECDLAIQAESGVQRRTISDFRDLLIGHYLGIEPAEFTQSRISRGGLVAAIDALNTKGRLKPVATGKATYWESLVSRRTLGDPPCASGSWRLRAPQPLDL